MAAEREHDPFELVPPPQIIRARIADNVVEAQALRRLLKISEDVAEHKHRQGVRVGDVEVRPLRASRQQDGASQ